MCVMCMQFRIIILIISLGQILSSYIANTSHTRAHARTHACTHTHTDTPPSPFRLSLFDGSPSLDAVIVQKHRHGTLQCLVTIVSLHFVLVLGV